MAEVTRERMSFLRAKMSQQHEETVESLLPDAKRTPGSGNQARAQCDLRQPLDGRRVAWAVECKATLAASFSVTRVVFDRLRRQAHHHRPMLAVRLYRDEYLREREAFDLAVLELNDAVDLTEIADCNDAVLKLIGRLNAGTVQYSDRDGMSSVERLAEDVARVLTGQQPVNADLPEER